MVIKWVDKRFINENKARKTECTSNQVVWTEKGQFWIPNLFLENAIKLVSHSFVDGTIIIVTKSVLKDGYLNEQNAPSVRGKTNLRYYIEDGLFDLWTQSYANIHCEMDFSLYPFDTQSCDFAMKGNTKNRTYQVQNNVSLK